MGESAGKSGSVDDLLEWQRVFSKEVLDEYIKDTGYFTQIRKGPEKAPVSEIGYWPILAFSAVDHSIEVDRSVETLLTIPEVVPEDHSHDDIIRACGGRPQVRHAKAPAPPIDETTTEWPGVYGPCRSDRTRLVDAWSEHPCLWTPPKGTFAEPEVQPELTTRLRFSDYKEKFGRWLCSVVVIVEEEETYSGPASSGTTAQFTNRHSKYWLQVEPADSHGRPVDDGRPVYQRWFSRTGESAGSLLRDELKRVFLRWVEWIERNPQCCVKHFIIGNYDGSKCSGLPEKRPPLDLVPSEWEHTSAEFSFSSVDWSKYLGGAKIQNPFLYKLPKMRPGIGIGPLR